MITTLLIFIALGLSSSIVFLVRNYRDQKNSFHTQKNKLAATIISIKQKQETLEQQVKIAEDFTANYEKSKTIIAQTIYEANVELLRNYHQKK